MAKLPHFLKFSFPVIRATVNFAIFITEIFHPSACILHIISIIDIPTVLTVRVLSAVQGFGMLVGGYSRFNPFAPTHHHHHTRRLRYTVAASRVQDP